MDIEEIEIMARCAGLMKYLTPPGTREWHGNIDDIVNLVRGAVRNEREACAKVCEKRASTYKNPPIDGNEFNAGYFQEEAELCAFAIRKRSND